MESDAMSAMERQQAATLLEALREACANDPSQKESEVVESWADQACAVRYLRARNHKHDAALKMLRGSITWRASTQPQHARCPRCAISPTAHTMRWAGVDVLGRPVCYMSFAHALDRGSSESNALHVTYMLESMSARFQQMQSGLEKWVWFVDFKGFGLVDNNPLTGQRIITLLQNHYPERLGMVVIYDAPWLFSACWKAFRVVMDERTREKVRFIALGDRTDAAWDFAPAELRTWLHAEIDDVRRARASHELPRHYWQGPRGADGGLGAQEQTHDPRGTASWLADPLYTPTPADLAGLTSPRVLAFANPPQ